MPVQKWYDDDRIIYQPTAKAIGLLQKGTGVISNGNVVQRAAGANMSVDFDATTVIIDGTQFSYVAGNKLVDAAPTTANQTRLDLIYVDSLGVQYAAGVAAVPVAGVTYPDPANLGDTQVALALIEVGNGVTSIVDARIVDTRMIANPAGNPNLVLNSDFGRRTVKDTLFMPEVFADTLGFIKIDAGAAPTVAANILTFGAANNELAWANGSFVWRDGRASASFKVVATGGTYALRWRIGVNDYVAANMSAGTFFLTKVIGGIQTNVASVAQALTLNEQCWLEVEKQGTTFIVKLYRIAVPWSAKSGAVLLQTLTGTVADASVQVGAHISITSDQATAQWGGLSASPGGVYVEGWGPESFSVTFGGTLGGQAVGFDESADSGPLSKQWALRGYIPATSRTITADSGSYPDGSLNASTAYTWSGYGKTSGFGGSGNLFTARFVERNSAGSNGATTDLDFGTSDTAWTPRKSSVVTTAATARRFAIQVFWNGGTTATGTAFFMLPQLEQGGVATAWRNAPADDGAIAMELQAPRNLTTASTSMVEMDARDLGINLFLPWDANLHLGLMSEISNNGLNFTLLDFFVDGTALGVDGVAGLDQPVTNKSVAITAPAEKRLGAGKHRIAAAWRVTAGTGSGGAASRPTRLLITAYRGR